MPIVKLACCRSVLNRKLARSSKVFVDACWSHCPRVKRSGKVKMVITREISSNEC
jgi:hypothetical protein